VGAITVQHFSSRNPTNWVDVSTSSAACTAFLKEWDTDSQGQANSATEVLGDFQLQVQLTNMYSMPLGLHVSVSEALKEYNQVLTVVNYRLRQLRYPIMAENSDGPVFHALQW
jgi:hypothetical protein